MSRVATRVSVVEQANVVTGEQRWRVLVEVDGGPDRWIDAADEQQALAMLEDFKQMADDADWESLAVKGRCEGCGQEVDVSPEGMAAGREEAAALFVDSVPLDALVCDTCWPQFLAWMREQHPEALR